MSQSHARLNPERTTPPDIDSDGSAQTPSGRSPKQATAMLFALPVLLILLLLFLLYLWM